MSSTKFNNKSINIIFDHDQNINFREWYPLEICDVENNTINYKNTYLFDGGKSPSIDNLNIDNYDITNNRNYPIINCHDYDDAKITVNNSSFLNLFSSINSPIFYSKSSIHIENSTFINIYIWYLILWKPLKLYDGAFRHFMFKDVLFDNISAETMFQSTPSYNDVK